MIAEFAAVISGEKLPPEQVMELRPLTNRNGQLFKALKVKFLTKIYRVTNTVTVCKINTW